MPGSTSAMAPTGRSAGAGAAPVQLPMAEYTVESVDCEAAAVLMAELSAASIAGPHVRVRS